MKILLRKFGVSDGGRDRTGLKANTQHCREWAQGVLCSTGPVLASHCPLRDDAPAVLRCSAQCLAKQGLLRAQLVGEAARFARGALNHIRTLGLLRDSQR